MVQSCSAYRCSSESNPRRKISFHMFPFSRPEVLESWIIAIRRDNWYPSKTSRLCEQHFLATDYQIKPGCIKKCLKLDAVPSVFSFTQHLANEVIPSRALIQNTIERTNESYVEATDIAIDIKPSLVDPLDIDIKPSIYPLDIDEPFTSTSAPEFVDIDIKPSILYPLDIDIKPSIYPLDTDIKPSTSTSVQQFVDTGTQTRTDNSLCLLRRKVKTLRQKLRRRDKKVANMKKVITAISKCGPNNTKLVAVLKNYFDDKKITTVKIRTKEMGHIQEGPQERL